MKSPFGFVLVFEGVPLEGVEAGRSGGALARTPGMGGALLILPGSLPLTT
jgi:hypothetical protein